MHHLRGAPTWAGSALITAGLLAIVLWRALPGPTVGWAVLVGAWLVCTVAVHVLLHNRWMRALDERCRAALAARRSPARGGGRAVAAPTSGTSPAQPRVADAPAGRGPAHATHRPGGRLAATLPHRRPVRRHEPAVIAPTSVPALPPLRPVGPIGAARTGSRYHHTGRPARRRPRAGRAA